MEEMDQLKELETLKTEKSQLLQGIEVYYRALNKNASFVPKAIEIVLFLQNVAQIASQKQIASDKRWLAYWGILEGDEQEIEDCGKTQTVQLSNTANDTYGPRAPKRNGWGFGEPQGSRI